MFDPISGDASDEFSELCIAAPSVRLNGLAVAGRRGLLQLSVRRTVLAAGGYG